MRKKTLLQLTALFSLLIALPTFGVYGQQVTQKDIYRGNDNVADTLIGRTGTYDPCCNEMTWLDQFTRSNVSDEEIGGYYYLHIRYAGVNPDIHHYYRSDNYGLNTNHSFDGSLTCGPSTSHEIILLKTSSTLYGAFIGIYAKATYWNAQQGRPQEP